MQIILRSDGFLSSLKAWSVNYPAISGYYVITDKMVIGLGWGGGDTYIAVDLGYACIIIL